MKLAKALVGTQILLAVLSGVFAAVNIAHTGPPAVIIIFTVLAVAAAISATVMNGLIWLFNLPSTELLGGPVLESTSEPEQLTLAA
jgi:hypothetical protein